MFRMRSRLWIISALLLLTTQCFAFKCRTCTGEECQNRDVEMRECTKFSTILPSEIVPLLSKIREKLLYACLKLEYHYGASTRKLEKCIITEDVATVCENIAKSIPYTHCAVEPPLSANLSRDTVSRNPVQLHTKILVNNNESNSRHRIRIHLKYYPKDKTITPIPNSNTFSELINSSISNSLAATTETSSWDGNIEKTTEKVATSETEFTSEENKFVETISDVAIGDPNEVLTPAVDPAPENGTPEVTTTNLYLNSTTRSADIGLTLNQLGEDDITEDISYGTASSESSGNDGPNEIITPREVSDSVTDLSHTTVYPLSDSTDATASKVTDDFVDIQNLTDLASYRSHIPDSKLNGVFETTELPYDSDSASGRTKDDYINSIIAFTSTENSVTTEITTTNFEVELSSEPTTILSNSELISEESQVGHITECISCETTTLTILNVSSGAEQHIGENEFYSTAFSNLQTMSDSFDVELSSEPTTIFRNSELISEEFNEVGHTVESISYETTTLRFLSDNSVSDQNGGENEGYTTAFIDLETVSDSNYTTITPSVISESDANSILSNEFLDKTTKTYSTITPLQEVTVSQKFGTEVSNKTNVTDEDQDADQTEFSSHTYRPCKPGDSCEHPVEHNSELTPGFRENEDINEQDPILVSPTLILTAETDFQEIDGGITETADEKIVTENQGEKNLTESRNDTEYSPESDSSNEFPNDSESFTSATGLTPDSDESDESFSRLGTTILEPDNTIIDAKNPSLVSSTTVPSSEIDTVKIGAEITKTSEINEQDPILITSTLTSTAGTDFQKTDGGITETPGEKLITKNQGEKNHSESRNDTEYSSESDSSNEFPNDSESFTSATGITPGSDESEESFSRLGTTILEPDNAIIDARNSSLVSSTTVPSSEVDTVKIGAEITETSEIDDQDPILISSTLTSTDKTDFQKTDGGITETPDEKLVSEKHDEKNHTKSKNEAEYSSESDSSNELPNDSESFTSATGLTPDSDESEESFSRLGTTILEPDNTIIDARNPSLVSSTTVPSSEIDTVKIGAEITKTSEINEQDPILITSTLTSTAGTDFEETDGGITEKLITENQGEKNHTESRNDTEYSSESDSSNEFPNDSESFTKATGLTPDSDESEESFSRLGTTILEPDNTIIDARNPSLVSSRTVPSNEIDTVRIGAEITETSEIDDQDPILISSTLTSTDKTDFQKTDGGITETPDEKLVSEKHDEKNHTESKNEIENSSESDTSNEFPNDSESFTSATGLTLDSDESEESFSRLRTTILELDNTNYDARNPSLVSSTMVPPTQLDTGRIGAETTKTSKIGNESREILQETENRFTPDSDEGKEATSSPGTTISSMNVTSIVTEAEGLSSVSSTMISPSELNFEPTGSLATGSTVEIAIADNENAANPNESSEEYAPSLDGVSDANLGYKVEISYIVCITSFVIYLVT